MSEVNFSDRTPRHSDPHTWTEKAAQVVLDGRVLFSLPVWLCKRSHAVSTISPRFLWSDDPLTRACAAPC